MHSFNNYCHRFALAGFAANPIWILCWFTIGGQAWTKCAFY